MISGNIKVEVSVKRREGAPSLRFSFVGGGCGVDLLQDDLLASGASLVWPRRGRPRATKSREVWKV